MSKRLIPLFSLMALICLAFSAVPFNKVTQAQGLDGGPPDRSLLRSTRPQAGTHGLQRGSATIDEGLAAATGPVKVMLELKDLPAAQAYNLQRGRGSEAQAQDMAHAQVNRIQQAQSQLVSQLSAYNARVTNRAQRVFNAITIMVDASRLHDIARLSSVKAIHNVNLYKADNAISVPLIGAPQVWTGTGFTGKGMQIGIIDSGVDYIHTDFGGTGSPISYTMNVTNTVTPGDGFPNAKVVGGRDFVGDNYFPETGDPTQAIPVADPDPMDCNEHGTHVAGTAAGMGVKADGTSFTGPYNTSTPFNTLRIGPGVAPEADIFALRVLGCSGYTEDPVMVDAIEFAVDPNGDGNLTDHLDVINLSIGGTYKSANGPAQQASDNASLAGVIVTGSEGNSADTYYIGGGSSGNARRAIAAAASQDSTDYMDGFRINTPPPVRVRPGSNSVAYTYDGPVSGDLVYPPAQRAGCQAFTAENALLLKGKIALLDWTSVNGQLECGSVARTTNARTAGAIGVILIHPQHVLDTAITGSAFIPSILVPVEIGQELKTALAAGTVNLTLTDAYNTSVMDTDASRTDTLSDFSSRGARRTGSLLKPDIAAPGQTILSAAYGTGNKSASFNGTSMAAPHVAGSMALLRQIHPDWSVEELKALVMNTANNDIRSANAANSPLFGPGRVGAGRITLEQAQSSQVVMYDANGDGAVSVSFGEVEVVGSATLTRQVRVANKGTSAATYTVGYLSRVDIPGVEYTFSPPTVTVAAGATQTISVKLTADAAIMQHTKDPTVATTQTGIPRSWLSEEAGLLTLTPATNEVPSLRLPLYAVARPASAMQAAQNTIVTGTAATAKFELGLTGQGVLTHQPNITPTYPLDEISMVTPFELQYGSPLTSTAQGPAKHGDLKNIGVNSDIKASGSITDTMITFGISTYGNWSSPNEITFLVYIDTDEDGTTDYILDTWNYGQATGPSGSDANDVFVTVLEKYDDAGRFIGSRVEDFINVVSPSRFNTVLFNNSVAALPVYAADLGLTAANSRFTYRIVSTFSSEVSGVVDRTPTLSYDAAKPGLDLSGGEPDLLGYFDLDGGSIPVSFDRAAYTANASKGLLLLHHHNTTGNHDEVVQLVDRARTYLPFLQR